MITWRVGVFASKHTTAKESLKTFEINIEILHIELQACL